MILSRFKRINFIILLWGGLGILGGLHCSNANNLNIEITAPSSNVPVGDTLQLTVTARDGSGNEVSDLTFDFLVNIPSYASVDATGLVTAWYPGTVEITASAEGSTSAPFVLTIDPPANSQTITQITNNGFRDDWGDNNSWKMITERNILFFNEDAGNNVSVYNLDDPLGTFTNLINTVDTLDFLAMGSGAAPGTYMASYRVNMAEIFVNNNGANTSSTVVESEENSVDQGCLYYREGGAFNNIFLFQFGGSGFTEVASTNELRDPIGSQCHAVWSERPGDGTSNLIFYDGSSQTPVVTGLDLFPDFDFSLGQVVYIQNDDLFHVDTTSSPFTTTQITNDGSSFIDQSPKTDGNSIVWIQEEPGIANDWRVYLYEIATGTTTLISPTTNEKILFSGPAINLKQVAWFDSLPEALYFYPGAGDASATIEVPLGANNLETGFDPYIENGVLTWIANDGDNEVFVMQ